MTWAYVTDDISTTCPGAIGAPDDVGSSNCIDPVAVNLNPANGRVNEAVTIIAYGSDGSLIGSEVITLPAETNMTGSVDSLDSAVPLSSGDHVRIVSDVDLCGFDMINADGRMEILPALK